MSSSQSQILCDMGFPRVLSIYLEEDLMVGTEHASGRADISKTESRNSKVEAQPLHVK